MTLFVALSILNASNYLFHVAVSRLLGPGEYGALAALLAVIMVLSVPLSVAQTVVAKRAAKLRAEGRESEIDELAAGTTRALGWFGAAGGLLLVVTAPILAWFLHTEAGAAALLGPYWFLSLILSVPLGVLQGRLRFGAFAATALGGVAVRLAAGIGLVWAGFGVTGAIVGTVLAQVAALGMSLVLAGIGMAWWRTRSTLQILRGEFGTALVALGAFWLFAEIDVILVRRYLDPAEAGFYASAGLVARALLFLPGAISIAALPRFAEARDGAEASHRLRLAMGTVTVLMLLAYPVLFLLRGPVVTLAFGDAFGPAAVLLPLLSAGMGFMALTHLLVFFHIAEGTRAHRVTLVAIGVEVLLITMFHETPQQIGWIVLSVAVLSAAVMYHAAMAACRWRPVASRVTNTPLEVLNSEAAVDVSVVLPCHNAGRGLHGVLRTLKEELKHVNAWEIIVVSDGSTDETVRIAREHAGGNIVLLEEPLHVGKGQALIAGLARTQGKYVAFMDADGDVDPRAIRPALALTELYEPDIILGSKRHPLSEVQYPAIRRVMSWTYHKLCRLLFRINVRDTQTGFKLIRRDVLSAALPRMLEKRYAFDLELLVVARSLGYKRVFEVPIRIDFRFESQVAAGAAFRIVLDTLAIFYRRFVLGTYLPPATAKAPRRQPLYRANGPAHRLRILFLNWRDIRNPDAGGAEMVTHEVGKRWVAQGHEVTLYTSRFPGSPKAETVDGLRIRRMGRLRNGTFHLRVQRELARLQGFDLVIDEINTVPFFTPLWRRRLPPIVALIHQLAGEVWDAELPKPLAALGKRLEPRMLRLYADVPVVTVSESTRQDLLRLGLEHVQVIPNGRDDPPPLHRIEKEPVPTFLFVGRLAANKRPDHAVKAFRMIREHMPSARLWVVGEGPSEKRIRRILPAGAEMLGRLPRDELYRRMARAHCLLVTSVREGWGLVIIEANSAGTPAVAYDVPGVRDSVRDGTTGILTAEGDVSALALQARSLVMNERQQSVFRQSAMAWAAIHSWRLTSDQLMKFVWEAALLGSYLDMHLAPGADGQDPVRGNSVESPAESARGV